MPGMELKTYLATHAMTDAYFAELIGVDRSSVTRMRHGGQAPRADVMRKIAEVTDGAVTPNDFFGVDPRQEGAAA